MEAYIPDYVRSDLGKVEIDAGVIRIIAALTCLEVDGVATMGGGGWMGDLADWFSKNLSKGVTVNMNQDQVTVDLKVVAQYGKRLHEVGRDIQEKVRYAIESMTGLTVQAVNVSIVDVEFENRMETTN